VPNLPSLRTREKRITKENVKDKKMSHLDLLESLYNRSILKDDETIVLAEGFDRALLGISTQEPKKAIYDYWICIDILLKSGTPDMSLEIDQAIKCLDEYIEEMQEIQDFAPIFIKKL